MERSYMEMFFAENIKQRPQDFMFTDKNLPEFEENMKRMRAERAAANPIKPEPAQQELNRLRSQLFGLQQNAKSYEQRVNDVAGNVHEFERRLTVMLRLPRFGW